MELPNLPPLFVYGAILVGFVITNLLLAHTLGPRKHTPVKALPQPPHLNALVHSPQDDIKLRMST